jgi:hypothetical protein
MSQATVTICSTTTLSLLDTRRESPTAPLDDDIVFDCTAYATQGGRHCTAEGGGPPPTPGTPTAGSASA